VCALAVAVCALAAASGACSLERSGYQYVRSPSTGTYLKVPDDWKVYGQREIDAAVAGSGEDAPLRKLPFISLFDGSKDPELDFDPTGADPSGIVRVRDLDPDERDVTSFASAREDLFVSLNAGVESGDLRLLSASDVTQEAAHGQRIVFALTDPTSGDEYVVDQTSLVDRRTSRLYLLAVGCRKACYDRNRDQIDAVATSLTIKER
jgi:hypothetical protein